jgi:hypothetical protein
VTWRHGTGRAATRIEQSCYGQRYGTLGALFACCVRPGTRGPSNMTKVETMNTTLIRIFIALAVASCAGAVYAQAASAPRAVGESASTAARAQAKAASNSDTGTLVRTGPSATHEAKSAAHHAEGSASSATHRRAHRAKHAASADGSASNAQ